MRRCCSIFACGAEKRLINLTIDDINLDGCAQALISDDDSLRRCAASVHDSLSVRGKSSTGPHHADITLGYLHVVLLAMQPTFEN